MATEDALLLDHYAFDQFLQEESPEPETDRDSVLAVDAWTQGDFLCQNYILNELDDSLYNVYIPIPMAKKL